MIHQKFKLEICNGKQVHSKNLTLSFVDLETKEICNGKQIHSFHTNSHECRYKFGGDGGWTWTTSPC